MAPAHVLVAESPLKLGALRPQECRAWFEVQGVREIRNALKIQGDSPDGVGSPRGFVVNLARFVASAVCTCWRFPSSDQESADARAGPCAASPGTTLW